MNSSKPSAKLTKRHQILLAVSGVVLILLALVVFGPWRFERAAHYAQKGERATDLQQATLNYRYANLLVPERAEYIMALAETYVALDQIQSALDTLKRLPITRTGLRQAELLLTSDQPEKGITTVNSLIARQSSSAAYTLKSRLLLELDRPNEAVTAGESAVTSGVGDSAAQYQLGLSYLVAGKTAELASLKGNMTSLEARRALEYAGSGKYQLAVTLANAGLLRSAQRAVESVSSSVSETVRLDATIRLARYRYSSSELQITADRLVAAVTNDPASVELRRLLKTTYEYLGVGDKAASQADLIKQLETGTP